MNAAISLSEGLSEEVRYNVYDLTFGRSGQQLMPEQQMALPIETKTNFIGANRIEEKLFSALAEMKVFFSQIAMHMESEWRNRLFLQLDRLHDPAEWDVGDDPVEIGSFRTFLRMMFLLKPKCPPGLALANEGHLLAHWINGRNRLSIECLNGDELKVVFTRWINERPDRGAIVTSIDRVGLNLSPYEPACWFEKC